MSPPRSVGPRRSTCISLSVYYTLSTLFLASTSLQHQPRPWFCTFFLVLASHLNDIYDLAFDSQDHDSTVCHPLRRRCDDYDLFGVRDLDGQDGRLRLIGIKGSNIHLIPAEKSLVMNPRRGRSSVAQVQP